MTARLPKARHGTAGLRPFVALVAMQPNGRETVRHALFRTIDFKTVGLVIASGTLA